MIVIDELKEILRIKGESIGAAQSKEVRMNNDFDEVYKMTIVKSRKERDSKLHNYCELIMSKNKRGRELEPIHEKPDSKMGRIHRNFLFPKVFRGDIRQVRK